MTSSEPLLVDRPAVPFIGTTTGVTMTTVAEIADRLPQLIGAAISHGITPAGPPFFRYLDLRGQSMTVQVGIPVPAGAALPAHTTPFTTESGELPAGRYLTGTHVGPFDELGKAATRLLAWADEQGLRLDTSTDEDGLERWTARLEIYHTDPRVEPDPHKYETELAFRLAD